MNNQEEQDYNRRYNELLARIQKENDEMLQTLADKELEMMLLEMGIVCLDLS